jgi:hypothetical protein
MIMYGARVRFTLDGLGVMDMRTRRLTENHTVGTGDVGVYMAELPLNDGATWHLIAVTVDGDADNYGVPAASNMFEVMA